MTNAVVAVAGTEEAIRAVDHASQQGVIWFLSLVVLVMGVAAFFAGKWVFGMMNKHTEAQFGLVREATAQIAANTQSLQMKVELIAEMRDMMRETRRTLEQTRDAVGEMKSAGQVMTGLLRDAAQAMSAVVAKLDGMHGPR